MDLLKFYEFVYDRQLVQHKKEILKEPAPWTDDTVLGTFLFCNVYRELDRGTKYLVTTLQNEPRKNVLLNTLIYRIFNVPEMFEDFFGGIIDIESGKFSRIWMEQKMDKRLERGEGLYRPAYTICQVVIKPNYRPRVKHIQITFAIEKLAKNIDKFIVNIDNCKTPQESMNVLMELSFVGPFLAYEIWCDLTYFNFFKQGWTDNDYVNIGPGAETGIQLLDPTVKKKDFVDYCNNLRDIQPKMFRRLFEETGKNWEDIFHPMSCNAPYLSLRNVEHSLCEFRKYTRLSNGLGRKRYYKPSEI